jgi:hypothetical protein
VKSICYLQKVSFTKEYFKSFELCAFRYIIPLRAQFLKQYVHKPTADKINRKDKQKITVHPTAQINNQLTLTFSLQRELKRSKLVISNSPVEIILRT